MFASDGPRLIQAGAPPALDGKIGPRTRIATVREKHARKTKVSLGDTGEPPIRLKGQNLGGLISLGEGPRKVLLPHRLGIRHAFRFQGQRPWDVLPNGCQTSFSLRWGHILMSSSSLNALDWWPTLPLLMRSSHLATISSRV